MLEKVEGLALATLPSYTATPPSLHESRLGPTSPDRREAPRQRTVSGKARGWGSRGKRTQTRRRRRRRKTRRKRKTNAEGAEAEEEKGKRMEERGGERMRKKTEEVGEEEGWRWADPIQTTSQGPIQGPRVNIRLWLGSASVVPSFWSRQLGWLVQGGGCRTHGAEETSCCVSTVLKLTALLLSGDTGAHQSPWLALLQSQRAA